MLLKICVFLLSLSGLNILRELILFYFRALRPSELNATKYDISNTRLILLGLSISYILTIMFTGLIE